jgi:chitin synthase
MSYLNPNPTTGITPAPSTGALLTALNRAYKNGEAAIWLHNSSLVHFMRPEEDDMEEQGPGVKELANRVWEHARRRAEDQVVVVRYVRVLCVAYRSGIAGSGKSKSIESIVNHITTLATAVPSSQSTTSQLTSILDASLSVLTSLTSAATPSNPYTSFHAGLTVTFSLDIYGAIASAQLSTPYVDASRLTNLPTQAGHRTFNAFYQLLRGATPQEQSHLSLLRPDQYEYLRRSGTWDLPSGVNVDDAAEADDFREALRVCGIKGKRLRGLYQTLAGCLLLGNVEYSLLEGVRNLDVLEDAAMFLDMESDVLSQHLFSADARDVFVRDMYRLLVEWVMAFINAQMVSSKESVSGAQITVVEIPCPSGKQEGYGAFVRAWTAEEILLQLHRQTFDHSKGLNAEMIADSINLTKVSAESNIGTSLWCPTNVECVDLMNKVISASESLLSSDELTQNLASEMFSTCYTSDSPNTFSIRQTFSLGDWIPYSPSADFVSAGTLSNCTSAIQPESFMSDLFTSLPQLDRSLQKAKIGAVCENLEHARIWAAFNLRPSESDLTGWDVPFVSSQVRTFQIAQHHAGRKSADFTADFTVPEFIERYSTIFPRGIDIRSLPARDCILQFMDGRKLPFGEWFVGTERVWIGELGWENLEGELDDCIAGIGPSEDLTPGVGPGTPVDSVAGYPFYGSGIAESREGLLDSARERYPKEIGPDDRSYYYGADDKDKMKFDGDMEGNNVEVSEISMTRRIWVVMVWLLTWPIPSIALSVIGRMKRKDVRMAWREKVAICFFIFLFCGIVIFYIIFFQRLICPEFDKVRSLGMPLTAGLERR